MYFSLSPSLANCGFFFLLFAQAVRQIFICYFETRKTTCQIGKYWQAFRHLQRVVRDVPLVGRFAIKVVTFSWHSCMSRFPYSTPVVDPTALPAAETTPPVKKTVCGFSPFGSRRTTLPSASPVYISPSSPKRSQRETRRC